MHFERSPWIIRNTREDLIAKTGQALIPMKVYYSIVIIMHR